MPRHGLLHYAPMTTQNPQTQTPATQKGLAHWFEIFEGGEQKSNDGTVVNLSEADLDKVVANSNGEESPLVYGHPKTNDPAYGWAKDYKREGLKIFAKAHQFAQEFSDSVEQGFFPNRSASLVKTDNGYKINHIGFLGAKKPAVKTLAKIGFNEESEALTFNFSMSDDERFDVSYGFRRIAGIVRKWRENLIAKTSIEEADKIIPAFEIDSIAETARSIESTEKKHHFTEPDQTNHEDTIVTDPKHFSEQARADMQAQLDAANDKAAAAEAKLATQEKEKTAMAFSAATAKAQSTIDGLVSAGKLLPAQVQDKQLAEFMAHLETDTEVTIEFSEGDGKTQKSPAVFFNEFLAGLGKQIELGKNESQAPDSDDENTPSDFHGHEADSDRLELMHKAKSLAAEKGISFSEAAKTIELEMENK